MWEHEIVKSALSILSGEVEPAWESLGAVLLPPARKGWNTIGSGMASIVKRQKMKLLVGGGGLSCKEMMAFQSGKAQVL